MLVKYAHDKKEVWDEYLNTCIYAYNTAVHESTCFTPFELMFGRKAVLPIDIDMERRNIDDLHDQYTNETNESDPVQIITDLRLQNIQSA